MCSMQFANTIVEWERRIAFEQENRIYQRGELPVNDADDHQQSGKKHRSIFEHIFGRSQQQSGNSRKSCKDTQPC